YPGRDAVRTGFIRFRSSVPDRRTGGHPLRARAPNHRRWGRIGHPPESLGPWLAGSLWRRLRPESDLYCKRTRKAIAMQLSAVGLPLEELDTPALLLDLDAFDRNVRRMAEHFRARGVQWRPHAKAFKC